MVRQPEPSAENLYARLGIAPDASRSQVNAAYRRLARALHPDSAQTPGGNPAQLRLVIEAHRILSDPRERERYDSQSRAPQSLSRSKSVTTDACAVCRGAGTIGNACPACSGTGYLLTNSFWLRTPVACPICDAHGHHVALCGACSGSGRT